jgi:tetratricopeptide (TPR) repeat protein
MTNRISLASLCLAVALLSSGPEALSAQEVGLRLEDPSEILLQGNDHYQEGRFQEALSAYEGILESGFESPDLYYNLGNAYFKLGDLGGSILNFEKALSLRPRDADTRANLGLARSLTVDEIEPLPRFWVLSLLSWWTEFLPRGGLILTVVLAYLLMATGLCVRILSRSPKPRELGTWVLAGSGIAFLLFGSTLLAREGFLGGSDRGVIMVEEVAVQSAPSNEGDLTLFHVHEGTTVRLDQRTEEWNEIVLEDGRVGWVPSGTMEII